MSYEPGTIVVHKALGNEPMVVLPTGNDSVAVCVRRVKRTQNGVEFVESEFWPFELETPIESIDREAEVFKILTRKQDAVNAELAEPKGPSGIGHLN